MTECTHKTEADDGTCRCPACTDRLIDVAHSGPPQDEGDAPDDSYLCRLCHSFHARTGVLSHFFNKHREHEAIERDPREDAEDTGRDAWVEEMNA